MNSGAKVYHFVIVAKILLTFFALNFDLSDTLLNFCSFSLHFEIFQPFTLPPFLTHCHFNKKTRPLCSNTTTFILFVNRHLQIRLSANCSSRGSSVVFMRERMVTTGSTISQSFMASIIVRITLPAVGAQLPFSMIPNLRFW